MSFRDRFRKGTFTHVFLHARLDQSYSQRGRTGVAGPQEQHALLQLVPAGPGVRAVPRVPRAALLQRCAELLRSPAGAVLGCLAYNYNGEIFVSDEIYRQEQEQVFARAWLFIGHESQIPKPGDYLTSSMGEESVILCRDQTGRIHVFLNSCRHRGMKVCRYDEGNTTVFTCPYHGWSYGTDGRLVGVPFFEA